MPFLTSELSKGNWGSAFVPHGMRIKGSDRESTAQCHTLPHMSSICFFLMSQKNKDPAKTLFVKFLIRMGWVFFQVNFSKRSHFKSLKVTPEGFLSKLRNSAPPVGLAWHGHNIGHWRQMMTWYYNDATTSRRDFRVIHCSKKMFNIGIDAYTGFDHTTIILKQNDGLWIEPSPKLSKTLASLCLANFFHNILFDVNLFNKSGKPLPFEGPEFC